jgi:Cu(I)/Ag(I) efflux system membrane fusion protein
MKKSIAWGLVIVVLLGGGGVLWLAGDRAAEQPLSTAAGNGDPLFYRHPMTPSVTSPVPAKDSMGMAYIPVYPGDAGNQDDALVSISPIMVNNLGVRTEPVTSGALAREIDTVGYIDFDERLLSQVNLRVEGWIEDLRVRTEGEKVSEGDLLFRVYSPELEAAQQEYLQQSASGREALVSAGSRRLQALGLNEAQIESLKETGEPEALVPIYARQDGIVAELNAREGMFVTPGTTVMTLAGLEEVWVLVDIFEEQADWVEVGQAAEMRLPHKPNAVWNGEVEFIYPQLNSATRTLQARLRFPNPGEELRPNMYADVTVYADPRERALSVPAEAVIRTGAGARVILARGEGRFDPAPVEIGIEAGDRIEILDGLAEGDRVVVSAQFLLDSEASLQASLRRMTDPAMEAETNSDAVETSASAGITSTGTLNSMDAVARKVNLSHAAIPELNWPAMTMDFPLEEGLALPAVETGQAVRFRLLQTDAGPVIVELEPAE